MIVPFLVALGLGGAGGYAFGRARAALQKEAPTRPALPAARPNGPVPSPLPQEQYREPDAGAVINIPVDAEDFRQMVEAFCVCFHELRREHGAHPSVSQLRDCFLQAIYPDFQWPPVPGDPSSAQLMWMIADHEARKIIADPSKCPPPAGGGNG